MLMHVCIVIILKIDPINAEMMKTIIIPSGGHFGSNENTISGHEYLHIAKKRVIGMLCFNLVTFCSIDDSQNIAYV
jgi:hypothetical protein